MASLDFWQSSSGISGVNDLQTYKLAITPIDVQTGRNLRIDYIFRLFL